MDFVSRQCLFQPNGDRIKADHWIGRGQLVIWSAGLMYFGQFIDLRDEVRVGNLFRLLLFPGLTCCLGSMSAVIGITQSCQVS